LSLERAGTPIGANVREFKRVKDLRIENRAEAE
jgi:hypothetical protein